MRRAPQTFTERVQSVAPKLMYQGLFHRFEICKTDSGSYSPGYHLRVRLKPDQVPDIGGMELTWVKKYFCGKFDKAVKGIKEFNGQKRQEMLEIMGTSIVNDLGLANYYIPDKIYVAYTTAGSSRIFVDSNFDFELYRKLIESHLGVTILEANGQERSNVNHYYPESVDIGCAFPTKLSEGGIIYEPGGKFDRRTLVDAQFQQHPEKTNKPTNIRTFEILGESEEPWNEPNVRSAFEKILLHDLMNPDLRPYRVAFTNKPDSNLARISDIIHSKIEDVIEKRTLMDAFRMRKKVPVGKRDALVVYGKGSPSQDSFIVTEKDYYYLDIHAKTRKIIEGALLQLN